MKQDSNLFLRVLLILVACASLGVTVLIGFVVLKSHRYAGIAPAAAVATAPASSAGGNGASTSPMVFWPLPSFSLTERSGLSVSSDQLKGKVWIASFLFTRCQGACPAMTAKMYQLQEQVLALPEADRQAVRLISITVDPEHDTPPVLAERARIARSDPTLWLWLTGSKQDIWKLAAEGFKLGVHNSPEDPLMPIAHSQRFVLVDRLGLVRGFYEGLEDEGRQKLLADLKNVLAEKD